jgi:hypothetical protein
VCLLFSCWKALLSRALARVVCDDVKRVTTLGNVKTLAPSAILKESKNQPVSSVTAR